MQLPPNVEFEAIVGLDFLVRGAASINLADGRLTLKNHDGAEVAVDLAYPRETDDVERVRAAEAGRQAAALAARDAALAPGDAATPNATSGVVAQTPGAPAGATLPSPADMSIKD